MKAYLFVPNSYSVAEMLYDGFKDNGSEVSIIDYQMLISHRINRFYEKTSGFPNKITKYWTPQYYNLINRKYLEYCLFDKPEIIVIYNNQFFYPHTIERLRENSKIVFILGDNPLWSKTFDYNLAILKYADLIISPDSHWKHELTSIGIRNVICDYIGYSSKQFFQISEVPLVIKNKYISDVLFIGRNYNDSSGYKRTLFLSAFAGLNFKIFGTGEWEKWLPYFPELYPHFNLETKRTSQLELNLALNCTKVCPIDQNTGIVNGIHLRVFEAIGAGSLPIVEWRKDIDQIFGELLPVIRNYSESREIVSYFIMNEQSRQDTLAKLKAHIETTFTPKLYVKRLIDKVIPNISLN
jgi:hypothetical protein